MATRRIIKGRGSTSAPAGRFEGLQRETVDDGWLPPPEAGAPETVIHWDAAKSVLSENESPDIPHELSLNPYRGCEHGCVYCFARPTHAYLGWSPGLDFETQIYAKANAATLLRRELSRRNYRPRPISLGIITDSYQPVERRLGITREILEVLAACRHPVSLITKSALIERDLPLLKEMAESGLVEAAVSITTLDSTLSRRLEPRAANPARRLKVIERLAAAGIPVTVLMAPIIPAVNDGEIEALLAAAGKAGACRAGYVILRLPHELREVFRDWLRTHLPMRAEKVMQQLRDMHGGQDYRPQFFARHKGSGVFAELIAKRVRRAARLAGMEGGRAVLRTDLFVPPAVDGQLSLFRPGES